MQIATTFCQNEPYYMEPFIEWYKSIWKADRFIFFRGVDGPLTFNHKTHGVDFQVTETKDTIDYAYQWKLNASLNDWFARIDVLAQIPKDDHPGTGLFVDCDEFLYTKDVNALIAKGGKFYTHFYEYVPTHPFAIHQLSTWSKVPWYYREQAIRDGACLTHTACKFFTMDTLGGCHHAGYNNPYCNDKLTWKDYETICFHIGVHSEEYFLKNKHALQTVAGTREIRAEERQNGYIQSQFDAYYKNCAFETFDLNLSTLMNPRRIGAD